VGYVKEIVKREIRAWKEAR